MKPGPGLFRFLLALTVFVNHVSRVGIGSSAVYIFFMLSGYWISVMWDARYSKLRHSYSVYIASRLWRLMPTFILCSIIAWALLLSLSRIPHGISPLHQVISTIFIFGYRSLEFQPIVPAWSLDIEVQFYVIAPVLIALVKRLRPIWALFGFSIISFCAVELNDKFTAAPYLVFFSVGVISAASQWKPRRFWAFSSLLGATVIVVACLLSPFKDVFLGGAHPNATYLAYNNSAEVLLGPAPLPRQTRRVAGMLPPLRL